MINDAGKHEVKSQRAITATGSIRVRCFCHDGAVATKKIRACKARSHEEFSCSPDEPQAAATRVHRSRRRASNALKDAMAKSGSCHGLVVEVAGPIHEMSVGAGSQTDKAIPCEVVGFSGANALLMPFAAPEGVRRGCRAVVTSHPHTPTVFTELPRLLDRPGRRRNSSPKVRKKQPVLARISTP
jgi:hypothetical protein